MSSKTNTWNAYESVLGTGLLAGSNSVLVADTAQPGLVASFYVVLEPDIPARREWIRVNTVTATAFENIDRGLEGSAGPPGVGVDHAVDSIVRAVFTKQLQDDLFHDVIAAEAAIIVNTGDIASHIVDTGDPHIAAGYAKVSDVVGKYLRLSGGTVTGLLTANTGVRGPYGGLGATTFGFTAEPTSGMYYTPGEGVRIGDKGVFSAEFVGGQIRADDGSAGSPSVSFQGGVTSGLYFVTGVGVRIAHGGIFKAQFSHGGIGTPNGSKTLPAYSFQSQNSVGAYRNASNDYRIAAAGADMLILQPTKFYSKPIYTNDAAYTANVFVGSNGLLFRATSARRNKSNITPAPHLADLDLTPVTFTSELGSDVEGEERGSKGKRFMGFIADDMPDELMIERNDDGEVENYDTRAVLAVLAAKVNRLENA